MGTWEKERENGSVYHRKAGRRSKLITRVRMRHLRYTACPSQKQARWLDISRGKFELSEWHAIADEWYRAKQNRNSDESDAPCMLRKGLPRAFPGLIEVKMESTKEGTQYRSRVFQSTAQLMQGACLSYMCGGACVCVCVVCYCMC